MIRYITILVLAIAFGCTSKSAGEPVAETKKEAAKPAPLMEKTFPFSEADKVEVISYESRVMWDTVNNGRYTRVNDLVKDGKLQMKPARINQRVILDKEAKKRLFNFLFIEEVKDGTVSACFEPRHSVLFYNKEGAVIAYLEVCLGCGTSESSDNFNHNGLDAERMAELKGIFNSAGLKTTQEDEFW